VAESPKRGSRRKSAWRGENPPQFNPQWAQQFRASYQLWKQGVTIADHGTADPHVAGGVAVGSEALHRCERADVSRIWRSRTSKRWRKSAWARACLKDKAIAWIKEREGPGRANVQRLRRSMRVTNEELTRRLDMQEEANRAMAVKLSERERKPRARPAIADAGDAIQ
jgi:type VI protein secretion system component VasA